MEMVKGIASPLTWRGANCKTAYRHGNVCTGVEIWPLAATINKG